MSKIVQMPSGFNLRWQLLSKNSDKIAFLTELLQQNRRKELFQTLQQNPMKNNIVNFSSYTFSRKYDIKFQSNYFMSKPTPQDDDDL